MRKSFVFTAMHGSDEVSVYVHNLNAFIQAEGEDSICISDDEEVNQTFAKKKDLVFMDVVEIDRC